MPLQTDNIVGLTRHGQFIYWANHSTGTVYRTTWNGSPELVASNLELVVNIISSRNAVIWATWQGIQQLVDGSETPSVFSPGRTGHWGLAADDTHLYFAESFGLYRAPLAGGEETYLANASVSGMALLGENLYWTSASQRNVSKIPKAGGEPTVVAAEQELPQEMFSNSTHVYWLQGTGPYRILRVSAAGGAPEELVSSGERLQLLAVDERYFHYLSAGVFDREYKATVLRQAIAGGPPMVLQATGEHLTNVLATEDGTHVYWVAQETLHRAPL